MYRLHHLVSYYTSPAQLTWRHYDYLLKPLTFTSNFFFGGAETIYMYILYYVYIYIYVYIYMYVCIYIYYTTYICIYTHI